MVVGSFPLEGKIAVVTGGGSGICLAFCQLALQNNCRCLVADLKVLPEAEAFIAASDGKIVFTKCDVSNWDDLESLPAAIYKAFGTDAVADIWIAGAGVFEPQWSSWLYDTEKDHYRTLQINAEHPIKLSRIAMRSLLGANKPGVVVILSSTAGIYGHYASALYCASKHAVVGFTKSMAQADIDESVAIKCVLPGMVATPLWKSEEHKVVADQFMYSDEMCITSEDVASAMKVIIEDGKFKGGSLVQVSKTVPGLIGELESVEATTRIASGPALEAYQNHCYTPLREIFGKERQDRL